MAARFYRRPTQRPLKTYRGIVRGVRTKALREKKDRL